MHSRGPNKRKDASRVAQASRRQFFPYIAGLIVRRSAPRGLVLARHPP
jgi:hypothetical protein